MAIKIMLVGVTPLLSRCSKLLERFGEVEVLGCPLEGTQLLTVMNHFRPDIVLYDVSYGEAANALNDFRNGLHIDGQAARGAFSVNSGGASKVALYCRMNDVWMWMVSDASVFPGKGDATSDTEPFPVHAFGLSRLLGERGVRTLSPMSTIIRVGWIYGPEMPDSPPMIAEDTRTGSRSIANVQSGILGSPTFVQDAAEILIANMMIATSNEYSVELLTGRTVHLAPKRAIDWWGYLNEDYPKVAPTHIKVSREVYLGVRNASLVPSHGWEISSGGLERFRAEIDGHH